MRSLLALLISFSSTLFATSHQGIIGANRGKCLEHDATWTPLYANIIGYWKLNGLRGAVPSGTSVTSVLGPVGTTVSSADMSYVSAGLDEGLSFNRIGAINLGVAPALKVSLPVTVSMRVRITNLPGTGEEAGLFSSDIWNANGGTTNGYAGYNIALTGAGKVTAQIGDNQGINGPHRNTKASTTSLSTGVWYHLVIVILGGGASNMQIYINGVDDGGTATGSGGPMAYNTYPSTIATHSNSGSSNSVKFGGIIDDLAVWNSALSPTQVALIYSNQTCN